MQRIKTLIVRDFETWEELKEEIKKRVKDELTKEFENYADAEKCLAEANYRKGIAQIITLFEQIESEFVKYGE